MRREATCFLLFIVGATAFSAPLKSYTTVEVELPDDEGRRELASVDQSVSVPLGGPWTFTAGAEYAAAPDASVFSDPARAGGRLGGVVSLGGGAYIDASAGVTTWFADDASDTSSFVFESTFNVEGATWYLGFRDRMLTNEEATVMIFTLHGKWYPSARLNAEAKVAVADEPGMEIAPSARAEIGFAPIPTAAFLSIGAGAGIERYSTPDYLGGGGGAEATFLVYARCLLDSTAEYRASVQRRIGDRNTDSWTFSLNVVQPLRF